MATVRDLIKGSMRLIGVLANGETPAADETADALSALNQMIDSWATENLFLFEATREEFTLTPSDGSYTIGSSGDFNTTRPIELIEAMIEDQYGSPTSEYPLDIITTKEWANITTKDLTADIPSKIYLEPSYPLAVIKLYPVPSAANKLVLYSKKPLTAFASANTTISLPPGYEETLKYNLAIRLAPEYGKEASATVVAVANKSKSNIKRKNIRPRFLNANHITRGNKPYNIYTGE